MQTWNSFECSHCILDLVAEYQQYQDATADDEDDLDEHLSEYED